MWELPQWYAEDQACPWAMATSCNGLPVTGWFCTPQLPLATNGAPGGMSEDSCRPPYTASAVGAASPRASRPVARLNTIIEFPQPYCDDQAKPKPTFCAWPSFGSPHVRFCCQVSFASWLS